MYVCVALDGRHAWRFFLGYVCYAHSRGLLPLNLMSVVKVDDIRSPASIHDHRVMYLSQ